ncbi:MAG TPA: sensor domain-containing diguanylate cyclase [Desulfurivibrio alkaliphilus]|uniref:diguanylate cyclase n=1 Tax=Desulfurivibrio alkaliphilus TaxID=427923 RepID=A0A7C2TMY6_9BACT|nr:sensor domain-containing diguanylate cyclase [Desulfurivibrio alkaliphilus]
MTTEKMPTWTISALQSLPDLRSENEFLKERLFELYLLYSTSRVCCQSLRTDKLLENFFDLLRNTMQVEEFCLMLQNPEKGCFQIWAGSDGVMEKAGAYTFRVGEGLAGLVAESGEAILSQDVSRETCFSDYNGMLPDIGAFLSVPLVARDNQVFGVLNIHKSRPQSFRAYDREFYGAVADNLAMAMERARLYEKARQEAMHDDLTGIYNRRYLNDYGVRELRKAKRSRMPLSLLLIDLDNFKAVNDTWGHVYGDEILVKMAALLTENVRQCDVVSRYGGDEFVILLPSTPKDAACRLAENLRRAVERQLLLDREPGPEVSVSVTVGAAAFPEDADDFLGLVKEADSRLYRGKSGGRNQVIC